MPPIWTERVARTFRGDVGIVAATVTVQNLLRLLSTIVLTRMLAPEDFGVVGAVTSVLVIATMLTDAGFKALVIRHAEGDLPEFLDTVWTIKVVRSLLVASAIALLSGPVSSFLQKPDIQSAIVVSSSVFLIQGLESLGESSALRRRSITRVSIVEISTSLFQVFSAITLATFIASYWAILLSLVFASTLRLVLSYAAFGNSQRHFRINKAHTMQVWAFARYVAPSSVIMMLVMQADKFIFARLMNFSDLGFYMIASNLVAAPMAFGLAYATRVLYPFYAQQWREHGSLSRHQFYDVRRRVVISYMTGVGFLIGLAPLLIDVLYDARYRSAAQYFQLLALASLLGLLNQSANEALTAIGRVQTQLYANLVRLGWLLVCGPIAFMAHGVIGVVAAVGLVELPALFFYWYALRRLRLLHWSEDAIGLLSGVIGAFGGYLLRSAISL